MEQGGIPAWSYEPPFGHGGILADKSTSVLGGSPIGEVAARFGTSRQSVDAWRRRALS